MKHSKRRILEAAGWKVTTPEEFFGLTWEDMQYVELKLALSDRVRAERTRRGLTQSQLARKMGSSQSRVAKMEAADRSVSVDLLTEALFALGVPAKSLLKRTRAAASRSTYRAARISRPRSVIR